MFSFPESQMKSNKNFKPLNSPAKLLDYSICGSIYFSNKSTIEEDPLFTDYQ